MDPATLLTLIATYRYVFLVPAALASGLLICMLVGVAIRLGLLAFFPAYLSVMAGELIGDVIWYFIGYYWGESFAKRFGKYVGIDETHIVTAKMLFRKHHQRILFSSKLTTGFGFAIPILFTAGMTRMSFWSFMWANLWGQFLWSGGLIAVGYFFGDAYLRVNSIFEKITIVGIAIMFVVAGVGFARYVGKRYIGPTT